MGAIECTRARVVLDDCREALAELERNPRGPAWRRTWVATVALLRAVGHVMKNVDRANDPDLAAVIDEVWPTMKEVPIFRDFIEQERNNVVKEYEFGAYQGVRHSGHPPYGVMVGVANRPHPIYPMSPGGPYAGRDQRDLVREAIDWWEKQLDEIETRAGARRISRENL